MMRVLALILGFCCLVVVGCNAQQRQSPLYSEVKTDLGATGNQLVADQFANYKAKTNGCNGTVTSDLKRVIVTGFGPFQTGGYNISGVISGTMGDVALWDGKVTAKGAALTGVSTGKITASDFGGRASVRTVKINGRSYAACFLLLDVKWDLAAAIIAHEAERFKPDMILMTGRGDVSPSLEGGAINRATQVDGYDSAGKGLGGKNIPATFNARILENHPDVDGNAHTIKMTWDNQGIRTAVLPKLQSMGYESVYAYAGAREGNDYVCNNVSYVVLSYLAGEKISLAGGKVVFSAADLRSSKAGFFHLPSVAGRAPAEVAKWIAILMLAIDYQLAQ